MELQVCDRSDKWKLDAGCFVPKNRKQEELMLEDGKKIKSNLNRKKNLSEKHFIILNCLETCW